MAFLNKAEDLWGIDDAEYREVTVPEWKVNGEAVTIRLKSLSGSERDRYEQSLTRMVKGQPVMDVVNARARLVAWSAVDESGGRIFTDGVIVKLGMKNGKALDRLVEAAQELSGLSEQDMEKLTEGFEEGQSEGSTTA